MTRLCAVLALGIAGLCTANGAWAEQCAARADIVKLLGDKYQESRRAIGLSGDMSVVEIFASGVGSWTIMTTAPNGMTCLVAVGQNFEMTAEPLASSGDPT